MEIHVPRGELTTADAAVVEEMEVSPPNTDASTYMFYLDSER